MSTSHQKWRQVSRTLWWSARRGTTTDAAADKDEVDDGGREEDEKEEVPVEIDCDVYIMDASGRVAVVESTVDSVCWIYIDSVCRI